MKRKRESLYVQNPFIKEENRTWSIREPASLARSVSPPPTSSRHKSTPTKPTAAQVEAGDKHIDDHLLFFSKKLLSASRLTNPSHPRLSHQSWVNLYTENATDPKGHHFIVHQHDHPVAGTHYDLRLQCNATSSVSWAIMYGLPGDPNSRRLNRNATETRIHCLWNHLIETASHQTGTLLIWDTGTYEVLPYHDKPTQSSSVTTDEEDSGNERNTNPANPNWHSLSEPEKLQASFRSRRIRLRLHGTKLPKDYTILLWLRRENDRTEQPAPPKTRRKKGPPSTTHPNLSRKPNNKPAYTTDSDRELDSDSDSEPNPVSSPTQPRKEISSLHRHESPPPTNPTAHQPVSPSTPPTTNHKRKADHDDPHEDPSDELIRQTNAYPGAHNSINSIHQRRWYLALDRRGSGFINDASETWKRRAGSDELASTKPQASGDRSTRVSNSGSDGGVSGWKTTPCGFAPFRVLGRDHERSVVTGRLAADILDDEGVVGYVPRGRWRAVLE